MRQPRIIKAFALSLVISGGCTWMLGRRFNEHAAAQSPIPDAMYAAPARSLKAGEILKSDSVELIPWPASRPLRSAFYKTSDVVGRSVLYPLERGEPILARDLEALGAGAGLAAKIPDGMRAIALRSDEIVGVAGFLNPGSCVDVLVTYTSSLSPDPITATVLQDVRVLAVGQRAQPDPEGKPATVTVVTLLLTPEEAERAVLASTHGSVHLLLRNSADRGHTQTAPLLLSMLPGSGRPPLPLKTARAHPMATSSESREIETVLATGSQTVGAGREQQR
jgi:pilus assembly protein CpaB